MGPSCGAPDPPLELRTVHLSSLGRFCPSVNGVSVVHELLRAAAGDDVPSGGRFEIGSGNKQTDAPV